MNVLRGGGDWLDRTLRIYRRPPGLAPPHRTRCRPPKSSDGLRKWSPCWSGRGSGQRRWSARRRRTSNASPRSKWRRRKQRKASLRRRRWRPREPRRRGRGNGRSSDRSGRGRPGGGRRCGRSDRGTGGCGGGGGRGRHGLGHRGRSQRGLAHAGLGRRDGRRHGQRRLADVQTLNGMQESGAIDHFFAQQLRRQPQVYRIDTDSESEPQAQPQQHPGLGTPLRAAVLRRPSSGERTGSCLR